MARKYWCKTYSFREKVKKSTWRATPPTPFSNKYISISGRRLIVGRNEEQRKASSCGTFDHSKQWLLFLSLFLCFFLSTSPLTFQLFPSASFFCQNHLASTHFHGFASCFIFFLSSAISKSEGMLCSPQSHPAGCPGLLMAASHNVPCSEGVEALGTSRPSGFLLSFAPPTFFSFSSVLSFSIKSYTFAITSV